MYDRAQTEALLDADGWARNLGIYVSTVTAESLTLALQLGPQHLNFLQGGHGGAVFSLAESAVAAAAAQRGPDPVLLDGHLVLTSGGRAGDVFSATVSDVKVGRSLGVFQVTVAGDDGRPIGQMTATMRFGQ